jgi:4-alpha-glucanotransferase
MSPGSVNAPPFLPEYRASGLLLHVTSLPSPYGIGDIGSAALSWIDRLAQSGQSWWQMLPLGPTGFGDSPYQPVSSFARNELLISPDWLIEEELLRARDCRGRSFRQDTVDYNSVIPFKNGLLGSVWANFSAGARADLRPAYELFRKQQAHWLEDYALFRGIKVKFGGAHYLEWPEALLHRHAAALDEARHELEDQIDQVRFTQFLLFRQLERLKAYAHGKGLSLGDTRPARAECPEKR